MLGSSQERELEAGFPAQQHFWRGPSLRFLGSGIRYAKFGWLDIQVRCEGFPVQPIRL